MFQVKSPGWAGASLTFQSCLPTTSDCLPSSTSNACTDSMWHLLHDKPRALPLILLNPFLFSKLDFFILSPGSQKLTWAYLWFWLLSHINSQLPVFFLHEIQAEQPCTDWLAPKGKLHNCENVCDGLQAGLKSEFANWCYAKEVDLWLIQSHDKSSGMYWDCFTISNAQARMCSIFLMLSCS